MHTFDTIFQFSRMLQNLDGWLGKAIEHAQQKNFDADVLAQARLAPDQITLVQQVQSACDAAKRFRSRHDVSENTSQKPLVSTCSSRPAISSAT